MTFQVRQLKQLPSLVGSGGSPFSTFSSDSVPLLVVLPSSCCRKTEIPREMIDLVMATLHMLLYRSSMSEALSFLRSPRPLNSWEIVKIWNLVELYENDLRISTLCNAYTVQSDDVSLVNGVHDFRKLPVDIVRGHIDHRDLPQLALVAEHLPELIFAQRAKIPDTMCFKSNSTRQ